MNTWGYLLLIAALLLLAGLMLYARFASRTREKSLHHAPFDWDFPSEVISSASPVGEGLNLGESGHSTRAVEPILRLERPSALESAPAYDPSRDRDYMDDLQEAAAGLAKLMRSSPVARVEPVVFAPEGEREGEGEVEPQEEVSVAENKEEEQVDALEEALLSPKEGPSFERTETFVEETSVEVTSEFVEVVEEASVEVYGDFLEDTLVEVNPEVVELAELDQAIVDVPVEAIPVSAHEAVDSVRNEEPPTVQILGPSEGLADSVVETIDAPSPEEVDVPRVLSIRDRLGDSVAEQFDRIDEGLDALESLVISIESSLLALAHLENGPFDGDLQEEEDAVAAAA